MSAYYILRSNAKYPEAFDTWTVMYRDGQECLSHHESEAEAKAAIRRYKAADRRRSRFDHNEVEARRAAARIADRIDGYDRDDLGESPDY